MKMNIGKLRTLLKLPPPKEGGKPLTEEQKRKRAGYIVYPVLVLLCAGCVWLALSPSEKEQTKAGQGKGFNTEIPLPEDSRMQESKVAAYEHEELEKKKRNAGAPTGRWPRCWTGNRPTRCGCPTCLRKSPGKQPGRKPPTRRPSPTAT